MWEEAKWPGYEARDASTTTIGVYALNSIQVGHAVHISFNLSSIFKFWSS